MSSIINNIQFSQQTASTSNSWNCVTYGNNTFVAVSYTGSNNRVMTSTDGVNWTTITNSNSWFNNNWLSVTYGNNLFVAVSQTGSKNRIMTSPDGTNWTNCNSSNYEYRFIIYANNIFVAVANGGIPITSTDGINWTDTNQTGIVTSSWWSVTYGNNLFVAVSAANVVNCIMTSTNGINWTNKNAIAATWYGIAYGNNIFVAVGANGVIMTSLDTNTWTSRSFGNTNTWKFITFNNGFFVAVGSSGTNRLMISSDGINWTLKTTQSYNWSSVVYGNNKFVAVAETGTFRVMTSNIFSTGTFNITNKTYLQDTSFDLSTLITTTNVVGGFTYTSNNTAVTISNTTATINGAASGIIITASPINSTSYIGTIISNSFTVNKASSTIIKPSNITKTFNDLSFTLTNPVSNSTGNWSFSSSDTSIISISSNTVTILGVTDSNGVIITATQEETTNYYSGTTTFKVIVNKLNPVIINNLVVPNNKIYGELPFQISQPITTNNDEIQEWTYLSSNNSVATISSNRLITILNSGTTNIKAILSETENYNSITLPEIELIISANTSLKPIVINTIEQILYSIENTTASYFVLNENIKNISKLKNTNINRNTPILIKALNKTIQFTF